MVSEKWGKRIKAYRKLKGYTQIQFASKLEVSVSVIGEVERGSRVPTQEFLNQIAEALGITCEELTQTN